MRALGYLGLLAAVVIVCVLAVRMYKAAAEVETPTVAPSAGVTSDQVHDEIRDTVSEAYGH